MSADNGVYIAKFKDGFRVAHAQAIDNVLDYVDGDEKLIQSERIHYFLESPVFKDADSAWLYARDLADRYDVLEYGVTQLPDFQHPFFELFKTAEEAQKYQDDFWGRKHK